MALNREAKVMQRIEEICKGVERRCIAKAMDARRSFDKQRQSMKQKRVATAKQSGERQRIEESRFAMELHGVELQ